MAKTWEKGWQGGDNDNDDGVRGGCVFVVVVFVLSSTPIPAVEPLPSPVRQWEGSYCPQSHRRCVLQCWSGVCCRGRDPSINMSWNVGGGERLRSVTRVRHCEERVKTVGGKERSKAP